ncbi:endolysin [Gordonia phage EricDab]|uniref:Lysin B n=1 Tax=Gordonia phage EricDab TaxID=3070616 RepID=A0A4D6E3E7_9CAUD|nr:endolysin [Gordonia phage EricDab]QBZ73178.1 lysin B [Gordonia phage EricDab]
MAKKTIYAVPGTWEIGPGHYPSTPIGMMKGVTDLLNRSIFDVQHVNYPARFGPIAGNGEPPLSQLGNPSYEDSVQMGVDEVVRLILEKPGKFGVIGYSQGGAIAAKVGREVIHGRLQHRRNDCLWIHTFGGPHRRQGHTFHEGNTWLKWGGIVKSDPVGGFGVPGIDPIDWFDYALPKDMFADANPDSYLEAGYQAVADMSLSDPLGWATSLLTAVTTGQIAEAANDLVTDPLGFARKASNTEWCVRNHIESNAHQRYGVDQIKPGWTALRHSANHLNYWGARR